MRMEELSNNIYIKDTDSVERYLLDLVKQYFESVNINDTSSREYIINKAVERMQQELNIDNAGVLSLNGETGDVEITLQKLNGEPLINPKNTAFNVDFGDEPGTACAGDDPRLSNPRTPVAHSHEISEVNGLNGALSTIATNINKLDLRMHDHANFNVLEKLTYSGAAASIDLTSIENISKRVSDKITETDQKSSTLETTVINKMSEVDTKVLNFETEITNLYNYIVDQYTLKINEGKLYVDNQITTAKTELGTSIDGKLLITEANALIDEMNKGQSFIGSGEFALTTSGSNYEITTQELEQPIKDYLINNNITDFKIETYIEYTDQATSERIQSSFPYVHIKNNAIDAIVSSTISDMTITIGAANLGPVWSDFIYSATIRYYVYAKNNIQHIIR